MSSLIGVLAPISTPPSPQAKTCGPALQAVETLLAVESASAAEESIQAQAQRAMAVAEASMAEAEAAAVMSAAGNPISGGALPIAGRPLEAQIAVESQRVPIVESDRAKTSATEQAAWSATQAKCSLCATCTKTLVSLATKEAGSENSPIQCCGADVSITPNGYADVPMAPGVMDKKIDILIKKIPIIGTNQIEFIKPAILNTIEQYYYAKIMSTIDKSNPTKTLANLTSFYTYLHQLESNFDEEIKNSPAFKKYKRELSEATNETKTLALFDKLKFSLIKDAHAVNFMSILGFGAKLFAMNKLLGKYLRNHGLPRPRNRMYTFGAMAAVNGAIVMFEGKKLAENKKHLKKNALKNHMQCKLDSHTNQEVEVEH